MNNKTSEFRIKIKGIQDQLKDFLLLRRSISPWKEALKIMSTYLIVGGLWILISDRALDFFFHETEIIKAFQLYKGWFYVVITGIIFYFVIHNKMSLFTGAIDKIIIGYEDLQSLAYYDTLTCLPNRLKLQEDLYKQIVYSETLNQSFAFLYIDIDNFRHVNDTMGHHIGDELILHFVDVLKSKIKAPNIIARLGGDEFAVVFVNIRGDIRKNLDQIVNLLNKPWMLQEKEFYITVSIGVAIYPEHGTDTASMIQNAETALFHQKSNGKNGYSIYTPKMQEKTLKYIEMSNHLYSAIQREEFLLYYQPQIDLNTLKIVGVEALIRWWQPLKGYIPPAEFIPFAEETGYINQIGNWVLKTACKQKMEWNQKGYTDIKLSINLSSQDLGREGLVHNVIKVLNEYQMNGREIEFEITETAVMEDIDGAIFVLNQLKELGISISLDDFGVGYSSLTYLQKLPIDLLKIDREFIKNVVNENDEVFIFNTIVKLAQNLGLKVIAEGVETKEQLSIIQKSGCDISQGYYFCKPLSAQEVEELFKKKNLS